MANEREPAVAGDFYPLDPQELGGMLDSLLSVSPSVQVDGEIIGAVVPHAGYAYSGKIAAISYSYIKRSGKKRFVIAGPNHQGSPPSSSTYSSADWNTPLGTCRVDHALENYFSPLVEEDSYANLFEHSVEVQLPFIQRLLGNDFTFFPIIMGDQRRYRAEEIGKKMALAGTDSVFIASSDLTHYEPDSVAREKDRKLIEKIYNLDLEGFYLTLAAEKISACGYGPIAALMHYTIAKKGRIIHTGYGTSGESSGDYGSVVGYPSLIAVRD